MIKNILKYTLILNILFNSTIVKCEEKITIAFGSCNKQNRSQDHWNLIENKKPDAFIWTGDIIYPDCDEPKCIKEGYDKLSNSIEYSSFKDQVKTIDGIYDDHDFGQNDAGKNYKHKEEARELLLDFLKVPKDSPRRTNKSGAYTSLLVGSGEHKIKIIILDTRFNRDDFIIPSYAEKRSKYIPFFMLGALSRYVTSILNLQSKNKGDILGKEQWDWLEKELIDSRDNANISANVIVSSIQVMTTFPIVESWGMFPKSRENLFNLLKKTNAKNIMFLSGDVHYGEILGDETNGIIEVTSSGFTHFGFGGKLRIVEQLLLHPKVERNNNILSIKYYILRLLDKLGLGKNKLRLVNTPLALNKNFGLIDFIFDEKNNPNKARASIKVLPINCIEACEINMDINLDGENQNNTEKKVTYTYDLLMKNPLGGGANPFAIVTILFGIIFCFKLLSSLFCSKRRIDKRKKNL